MTERVDVDSFAASRSRFGQWEIVSYCAEPWQKHLTHGAQIVDEDEDGVRVRIQHGTCHCGVCGHRYTYECDEADPPCECCDELCR